MRVLKKISLLGAKAILAIILIAVLGVIATSISPIYDFKAPEPFSGPDVFNPYSTLNRAHCWKRANFHTHTKVDGIMNECDYSPAQTYEALEKFGYDIVTFSNHNELTQHPFDSCLQVNLYEHGYNLTKFHKLVFGCNDVWNFDHLLPLLASQKQFQINMLKEDSDMVQFNHPLRTKFLSQDEFEKLSGYDLIELDSGRSTENEYWDRALSAGHYSFALANDDLHYPDKSHCIAVRCNFLCCRSARYEDILETLRSGCFYSMRIPDYGNGDWQAKYLGNQSLPSITDIGLRDNTIFITLSEEADSIKVIGQGHSTLLSAAHCNSLSYTMARHDPYARITAYFPDGEVIYTNAFARYDASASDSPFKKDSPKINISLTVLFNLLLVFLACVNIFILYRLIFKR
jgi:hypothetical protein